MTDLFKRWLEPQAWKRDGDDDPVIGLGATGDFDDMHLFAPCGAWEDDQFRLYYCGSSGDVSGRVFRLGHASGHDGIHFRKHLQGPVYEVGDDAHSVLTPAILRQDKGQIVRENDCLRMWYSSTDFPGRTGRHTIHDMTSADGLTWNTASAAQLEDAYAPSVLKVGDSYRLWYTDVSREPWSVRHAVSDDGCHWTVTPDPVLVLDQAWEHGRLFYPYVLQPAHDLFVMWYGSYQSADPHKTALGIAVSRDGIAWEKSEHNPVFGPDPLRAWESHYTTSQSIQQLPNGSWRMWYASRPAPPFQHKYFAIGTASWEGPGS